MPQYESYVTATVSRDLSCLTRNRLSMLVISVCMLSAMNRCHHRCDLILVAQAVI